MLLLLMNFSSMATTYYVSPGGNDVNAGTTSTAPWKTIARVQQAVPGLVAGDRILFERGGRYSGQLSLTRSGVQGQPIEVSDYGYGALPIISGSVTVTGWVQHSGSIYRTTMPQAVKYLYCGGAFQTLARTPNSGWSRVATSSKTQLTSANITQGSDYWTGGELVIRSTNWCYENATITSNAGNGITYSTLVYNPGNYAWGFFLRNKLAALDAPGEWYHDAAAGILYFWAPGSANPNTLSVDASVSDYGVKVGSWSAPIHDISISNIRFTGQKQAGVKTEGGCARISVLTCEFTELYHGINSYTGTYNQYNNNRFWRTYATAVHALDNNTSVNHNRLDDIALVAGSGETFFGYYGIQVGGANNVVRGNRLNNIGYSGIFCDSNALVELNFVKGHLSTLNDGGGIYWDSGSGVVVQDNIAMDPIGNMESVAMNYQTHVPICMGMYFGNSVITGARIRRNTAIRCEVGIIVDHTMASTDNQITDNVMFGNRNMQIGFADYSNTNGTAAVPPYAVSNYNDIFSGNTCYAMSPTQYIVQFVNQWYDGVDFGTFDNNKYYNPWKANAFTLEKFIPSYSRTNYTLAQWSTMHGGETRATGNTTALTYPNGLLDNIIVYNDSLTSQSKPIDGIWFDLDGNQYVNSISLPAFGSKVLVRAGAAVQCRAFLQGPLSGSLMSDALRVASLVPLSDPYPALGYVHVGSATQGTTLAVLSVTGPNAIVDWVVLELRKQATPSVVAYSRSALIQRDGDIVDVDGVSPVQCMVGSGSYYVSIHHRNHLGVMTANALGIPSGAVIDFTASATATWGVETQATVGTFRTMWTGDCNGDGAVKYSGAANDRDKVLARIGGIVPTNVVPGYWGEDVNLDGVTMYTGSNNDRDRVLMTIGGVVPTNVRAAQLP